MEKLLRAGTGWLAEHPAKAVIARRYLAHRTSLTERGPVPAVGRGHRHRTRRGHRGRRPRPESLAALRRTAVVRQLAEAGASRVLDLGCGPGALLAELIRDRRFTEIVGADVSTVSLDMAARRLRLDRLPDGSRRGSGCCRPR